MLKGPGSTFRKPRPSCATWARLAYWRCYSCTIAEFFVSGGATINQPQPARFFEFPIVVMPEDYSYIP